METEKLYDDSNKWIQEQREGWKLRTGYLENVGIGEKFNDKENAGFWIRLFDRFPVD